MCITICDVLTLLSWSIQKLENAEFSGLISIGAIIVLGWKIKFKMC